MMDRTKQLFADKIMQLAKNKPIKDIQIKELCVLCGVERTTFYYHFRDKYDLVAWIFKQNYIEEASRAETINDERMIREMFQRLSMQKEFFLNALQDSSQNNLREYMLAFYIGIEEKVLCEYYHTDSLNEELLYEVRNYSFGCMGQTIDWLLGKNNLSAEKMAHYQYKFMPEELKNAFQEVRATSGVLQTKKTASL
jgi:AcrR family transcriptional regulator